MSALKKFHECWIALILLLVSGPLFAYPGTQASVNATGLLTPVPLDRLESMALISANDAGNCCGDTTVVNGVPMFAPGSHRLDWAGSGTSVLNVIPMVSLGPNRTVAEGEIVTFPIFLNGPAPTRFAASYTVSGTAGSQNDDLADGSVTFNPGDTKAEVTFHVLNDKVVGTDKTIVVTLDPNLNLGEYPSQTFHIVESNLPPTVSLSVHQGGKQRDIVSTGGGVVMVGSTVNDPNPGSTPSYDWSGTDSRIVDTDTNDGTLTFNPGTLTPGIYKISLLVTDDGTPAMSRRDVIYLDVRDSLPVLSASNDTDGDGIDDATEGLADSNGNGIPDYLDSRTLGDGEVLPEQIGVQNAFLLECDPGVVCRPGEAAVLSGSGGALVVESELDVPDDNGYRNVDGLFDFEARVKQPGGMAHVVVPQRRPIPADAVYRMVNANGQWNSFRFSDGDDIASAPGSEGVCPPPGDAVWTPGLTKGDWCVRLTLTDGGPNDADGTMDGFISDPGGVAGPVVQSGGTAGTQGAGGNGIAGLMLLSVIGIWRRRAKASR